MKVALFVTHQDMSAAICSSCTYDIMLVAQILSCYVGYSHTLISRNEFHQYVFMNERNNVSLLGFNIYHNLSSFFSIVNRVEEVEPFLPFWWAVDFTQVYYFNFCIHILVVFCDIIIPSKSVEAQVKGKFVWQWGENTAQCSWYHVHFSVVETWKG
jgi:hypothetical protein